MESSFEQGTLISKAMANENRIRIVNMLSCEQMCACDLGDFFDLTQPTLSHHLAILKGTELITSRKNGKWTYYGMNWDTTRFLMGFLDHIPAPGEAFACRKIGQSPGTTSICD